MKTITNLLHKIAEWKRQGYTQLLVEYSGQEDSSDAFDLSLVSADGSSIELEVDWNEPWVTDIWDGGFFGHYFDNEGSHGTVSFDLMTLVAEGVQVFQEYSECSGNCGHDENDPDSYCDCDTQYLDGDTQLTTVSLLERAEENQNRDEFFALGVAMAAEFIPETEEAA